MTKLQCDDYCYPSGMAMEVAGLTTHAKERMALRGIRPDDIEMVLLCGREAHARGAVIQVIGRKEIAQYRHHGLDLASCEGLHVICSLNGSVLTAYRNRSDLMLKDYRRPRSRHHLHQ